MEFYLFYCSEQDAEAKDYDFATLVKIDGSFYYFDENTHKWVTDVLYDDYCSSFTEAWREKSPRVVEITEEQAQQLIDEYYSK